MRPRARLPLAPRLSIAPTIVISTLLALLVALAAAVLPARLAHAGYASVLLRPGTTLAEVAAQWNTTPETLRYLNDMGPRDVAWSGMRMRVPPQKGVIVYAVQKGDTPSSIAATNAMPLARFVELNLAWPAAKLQLGDRVLVDSAEGIFATRELPVYTVAPGDTGSVLAERFGTSVRILQRVNPKVNIDRLRPGTRIVIAPLSLHERLAKAERDPDGYVKLAFEDLPTFTGKWIVVDLREQRLVAYEGTRPVKNVLISSGRSPTPTVTGVFRIRAKVEAQRMSGGSVENGDYYNLPNVQWVSYFYGAYAFHGTYWHKNFGHPMSHGCVNMTNADAEWLYEWSSPTNPGRTWFDSTFDDMGTLVIVHR